MRNKAGAIAIVVYCRKLSLNCMRFSADFSHDNIADNKIYQSGMKREI